MTGFGLNLRVVKWAKKQDWRSENLLINFDGKELNRFNAAFFSVIGKALHLTGSEAPIDAILDLKASICS